MASIGRVTFILVISSLLTSTLSHVTDDGFKAESLKKATSWLLQRRNNDLHWGRSNALALLALSNSLPGETISSPELRLAQKQLDIDFLVNRLRHGDLELYSDRLIPLAVTLTSLCRSPMHYYDYDLLDGLLDHRRQTDNFTFVSELLAVCGGDGVIRRAHIRRLLKLLNSNLGSGPSHDIDTISMVVMATGCVGRHYGYQSILPFADRLAMALVDKQLEDGSFHANVVSTALAVQALKVDGLSIETNASRQTAEQWLRSAQLEDGSFQSDFLATVEALMALSPLGGRSHIHLSRCHQLEKPTKRALPDNMISIQILIWVGQPVLQRESFYVTIPQNSTVYEALKLAEAEGLLRFETQEFSFGHYVASINNMAESESGQQRWMVYALPNDRSQSEIESTYMLKTAISSHHLRAGERILFWYQPLQK